MAKQITRTVTIYKVSASKEVWSKGVGRLEEFASVEIEGTSLTRTEARAALIAAGYKVPRGTHIEIEEISNALYTMPLDFFMANAVKVDETQEA